MSDKGEQNGGDDVWWMVGDVAEAEASQTFRGNGDPNDRKGSGGEVALSGITGGEVVDDDRLSWAEEPQKVVQAEPGASAEAPYSSRMRSREGAAMKGKKTEINDALTNRKGRCI